MKSFKKLLALVLAGMTAVNMSAAALAEGEVQNVKENAYETEQMKSYIKKQAPILIYAAGIADPAGCRISNLFPIYDAKGLKTGRNISFIIQNGNIVGDIVVAIDKNGVFSASSELRDYPEVNDAFQSGTAVSFCCYENDFIMTDGKTALILLSEYEEGPVVPKTFNSLSDIEADSFCRSSIFSDMQIASVPIYENSILYSQYPTVHYDTRVDIVGQGERGTCWAACVASKVSYEIAWNVHYTADDIYDAVIEDFGSIGSKRTRYERGLSAYGFTMDASFTGIKPFGVLQTKTQNEWNLVILRLQNDDGDGVHAVVLKGYQIINPIEGSVYLLMDPNKDHHVAVSISDRVYNGLSGFTYVSKIGSYTWFDSICTKKGE